MEWLVIGLGLLLLAGVVRHRRLVGRWEHRVDPDA